MNVPGFDVWSTFAICAIILLANLAIWRDMRSPAILHSILWTTIIGLFIFVPHGLFPLREGTYLTVVAAVFVFSLGSVVGYALVSKLSKTAQWRIPKARPSVVTAYGLIALAGLPVFVNKVFELASSNSTGNFLIDIRIKLTESGGSDSFGNLKYLLPIGFSFYFITIADNSKSLISKKGLGALFVCLAYSILSTGRTYLFLLVIPSIFIIALNRRYLFSVRNIALSLAILFALFTVVGFVYGKIGENPSQFFETFSVYLLGGLGAYDQFSQSNAPGDGDYLYTMRSIYAIQSSMGYAVEVRPLIMDYSFVPQPTNVYTVFFQYYLDFGISLVLISQFLFGVVHSALYAAARRRNECAIIFYSLSAYPLFMQFFQDQYVTLLSQWVIFSILIFLPYVLGGSMRRR